MSTSHMHVLAMLERKVVAKKNKKNMHRCTCATSDLEELVASRDLLIDHACKGNHGEAAIVDFFRLHGLELFGRFGLEAKWVKAKVAWHMIGFD
mmetsp:Transcript_28235/g.52994  ORF Transcript_28235/g.52994 Transcript_28235/m.52994 type:complete len:94 (+) Transcript_28235:178-459(+)